MAIFKKGDTDLCENYRPITVVSVGYKLFAMILLKRLHIAGAEERIWPTQFAFRSKHGSADAIFVTRRMVDLTLADRDGTLVLLALDWAKAFDSISPTALLSALGRFGIPTTFRRFIQAIYNHRTFTVQASGCKSAIYVQHFGISQGCPLSPFLFSILMTVLFTDASPQRKDSMDVHHPASVIKEVIYADDTLLVAVKPEDAESFTHDVVVAGKVYGLSLN